MSVQCGTCKWFDVRKGFGFITPDKGGPDLFCHQTSLKSQGFRALAEGERVEFTVEIDGTGRAKAVNVTGPDGVDCQGPQRRHFPSRDNYYDDHAYKPSNGFSSPSYRSGGYNQRRQRDYEPRYYSHAEDEGSDNRNFRRDRRSHSRQGFRGHQSRHPRYEQENHF